jgi:hypothetical protein
LTGAEVENSNTLTFKIDRTASAAPVLQSPPDGTQFLARHPGTSGAGTIDIVVAGTAVSISSGAI